jgi:hypothetical protein
MGLQPPNLAKSTETIFSQVIQQPFIHFLVLCEVHSTCNLRGIHTHLIDVLQDADLPSAKS